MNAVPGGQSAENGLRHEHCGGARASRATAAPLAGASTSRTATRGRIPWGSSSASRPDPSPDRPSGCSTGRRSTCGARSPSSRAASSCDLAAFPLLCPPTRAVTDELPHRPRPRLPARGRTHHHRPPHPREGPSQEGRPTMTTLTINVVGTPAPQGSKRAFVVNGRAVMAESSKKVKPWRQDVAAAVQEAIGEPAIDWHVPAGPVRVDITYYLPRPRYHYRTGKNAHLLKPGAPTYVDKKPDKDKLRQGDLRRAHVLRRDPRRRSDRRRVHREALRRRRHGRTHHHHGPRGRPRPLLA